MTDVSHDEPQDTPTRAPRTPASAEVSIVVTHDVDPTPDGVRAARAFVRATVQQWGLDVSASNAALDVSHELVTNAVQHGGAPILLGLEHESTTVRVTVADRSPDLVRRLPYRAGVSERGLGLRLVAQLSLDWGQRSEPDGKTVWATVDARASRPRR